MVQPIRRIKTSGITNSHKDKKKVKNHPKYGTSKLEERFARDFLEKMGYDYERQYEAKEIGRFYDFKINLKEGDFILIEIDGNYFHGRGLLHEEKNPMQKHNERVDRLKDEWAAIHGIPLIRIWEHDINNNPEKVRTLLKTLIGDYQDKFDKKNKKNKRH